MSGCTKFEELISLSVSGELSPAEREELRAHLAGCEACRGTLVRETRLWALIQQARAAAPALPEGISERLAGRAREAAAPGASAPAPARTWRRRAFLWAAAAAAAVLLVVGLVANRGFFFGADEATQVAQVASGRLLVKDGESWRESDRLMAGQVFRVPGEPGSAARLVLADGSRLDLERGMSGWLGRGFSGSDPAGRRVELFSGALTAEVAKGKGRFTVNTPGGNVTATGTRFWVRSGPPEGKEEDIVGRKEIVGGALAAALAVAVFEGSVLVQSAGAAEPVPVRAGEQAAADAGKPLAVNDRTVASAVPAGALFFVATAGREKWKKSFEDSNLGAAYREEEVKAFLLPFIDKINARIAGGKKDIEAGLHNIISFAEIEKALVGEVGVAVLSVKAKVDGGKEEPVVLLVAEVGENAAAFENGMDEFVKRVNAALGAAGAGAGGDLRARNYRGADLRTFTIDKGSVAYARAKGYFLFALDAANVEKGIDCLEGVAPSLAASPVLKKSDNGLLAAAANIAEIVKAERAKEPKDDGWKFFDALGFGSVTQAFYRLDFEKPLFCEKLSVEFTEARGLLALAKDAKPVDAQKMAAEAPADALFFAAANLPSDKVLDTVFRAVDAVDQKKGDEGRRGLVQMKEKGLDLEALLAKSLTGEVALWAAMPPAGAGMFPDVVIVARTKENLAVEGLIQMLAREAFSSGAGRQKIADEMRAAGQEVDWNKVNEEARKRAATFKLDGVDYKGGKLYALPVENGNPLQVSALVMPDRVIFASNAMAAKRAAAKPAGGALADKPAFRDALGKLSPNAVGVQYIDTPAVFGKVYGTVMPFLGGWKNADKLHDELGLDLKKLPPAESVMKHLVPEVGAFYADGRGVRLEACSNAPRALTVGMIGAGAWYGKAMNRGGAPAGRFGRQAVPGEREEF